MIFKSKLATIDFDIKGAIQRERIQYIDALKLGVRAWIQTAQANIPLWTGASRASLEKLVEVTNASFETGVAPIKIDISTGPPAASAIGKFGDAGIRERISQARQESTGEFKINKRSISFSYSTSLPWLVNNELGITDSLSQLTKRPIPYNFLEKSDAAAQSVLLGLLRARTIDLSKDMKIKIVTSK